LRHGRNLPDSSGATSSAALTLYDCGYYMRHIGETEVDSDVADFIDNAYRLLTGTPLFEMSGANQQRLHDDITEQLAKAAATVSDDSKTYKHIRQAILRLGDMGIDEPMNPFEDNFKKLVASNRDAAT